MDKKDIDSQLMGPYYRRPLPIACIDFSSIEGKRLFLEALQNGYMAIYFKLAAQFRTQEEPAFCGLTTLVMTLNALEVDPGRVWKGSWKWYHESMLDCCKSLDEVKVSGIHFEQFCCLARCNRLVVRKVYAPVDSAGDQNDALSDFRSAVMSSTRSDMHVLAVSYDRSVLKQTGTGHFSPIGGYHSQTDRVLILDVARFKYPPHWVELRLLFKAMQNIDPETGRPRGYVTMSLEPNSKALVLLELRPNVAVLKSFYDRIEDWIHRRNMKLIGKSKFADPDTSLSTSFLDIFSATVQNQRLIDLRDGLDFTGSKLKSCCECRNNQQMEILLNSIQTDLLNSLFSLPEYKYFNRVLQTDNPKLPLLSVCLLYSWPFDMHLPQQNAKDVLDYRQTQMVRQTAMASNELSQLNKQLNTLLSETIKIVQPQNIKPVTNAKR